MEGLKLYIQNPPGYYLIGEKQTYKEMSIKIMSY